jgi:hypothetical protein
MRTFILQGKVNPIAILLTLYQKSHKIDLVDMEILLFSEEICSTISDNLYSRIYRGSV